MVIFQELDAVERSEGEERFCRPEFWLIALLNCTELPLEDGNEEVPSPSCGLQESLVHEPGAGFQFRTNKVEHLMDHAAGRKYLAIASYALAGPDQLLGIWNVRLRIR